MKTPEPPRSYLSKLAESPASEEKEEKILPRYVEVPALREHGFGPRNLFWGVVTLVFALVVLIVALFFAGPRAALSVATTVLTFAALFVLARLHIFRQRNGAFLALALVCLLGALVPLVESGFASLKDVAARSNTAPVAPGTAETAPPLLTESFAVAAPEETLQQVKVLKDSLVAVGDKSYRVQAGELFPFIEKNNGEVTFAVRGQHVVLPVNVVEILDSGALAQGVAGGRTEPPVIDPSEPAPVTPAEPSADDLAAITMSAQREAIRRYPALGMKNSLENEAFVSTYQQLRESGGAEFFTNPEWPIELAELLAKREGWSRGGPPATTGPAPVLDASGNLPPVDELDAGADLPQVGDPLR